MKNMYKKKMWFLENIIKYSFVLFVFLFLSFNTYADNNKELIASGEAGENIRWSLYNDSSLIFEGTGQMSNYQMDFFDWENSNIPEWVSTIWDSGFNQGHVDITVGEGITYIGDCVFSGLSDYSLSIPSTVDQISNKAFTNNGPNNVQIILASANQNYEYEDRVLYSEDRKTLIYANPTTQSFVIPETVEEIAPYAFYYNYFLSSVSFPENLHVIGTSAFEHCGFSSIDLPTGLERIEDRAFAECAGDCSNATITIPAATTQIGNGVFAGWNKAKSFIVDANNPTCYVADGILFLDNGKVLAIFPPDRTGEYSVPEGTHSIDDGAFQGSKINKILIPDGLVNIGKCAFSDCLHLRAITLPESLEQIGVQAFCNSHLRSIIIPGNVKYISRACFESCFYLNSITIQEGTQQIENRAFFSCKSLNRITIPKSLTFIGNHAFYGCKILSQIAFNASEHEWNSINIGSDNDNLLKAIITFSCGQANGSFGENGNNLNWSLDADGNLIINGIGGMGERYRELCPWQLYRDSIHSVYIGDNVTDITFEAFRDCSNLENIFLSSGLRIIHNSAFEGCRKLKNINIPEGVTAIYRAAFKDCASLRSIHLPASVTQVNCPFIGCTNLESITVDESNQNYSSYNGCLYNKDKTSLICVPPVKIGSDYTFPSGISNLADFAFSSCLNLRTINLAEGIKSIPSRLFYACTNLDSVTLPASLEEISLDAFTDCGQLKDIYFNGTLEQWSGLQFINDNRSALTASIHFLGNSSGDILYSGSAGTNITWEIDSTGCLYIRGSGVLNYGNDSNPPWYKYRHIIRQAIMDDGITEVHDRMFYKCSMLLSVYISQSTTTIGYDAFNGCTRLQSLNIPEHAQYINMGAFDECYNLMSIKVDENNEYFKDIEGVLFTKNGDKLIRCPGGKQGEYYVPEGTKTIDYGAFKEDTRLEYVDLPEGVNTINNEAFSYCTSLEDISIPDSVRIFGNDVFSFCFSMEYISIDPEYSLRMGTGVFSHSSLKAFDIDFGGEIPEKTFEGCSGLTFVDLIHQSVSKIGENAFFYCDNMSEITLPSNGCSLEEGAFKKCSKLTNINNIEYVSGDIKNETFAGCTCLQEITLSSNITGIYGDPFLGCSSLTNINVNENNQAFCSDNGVVFNKEKIEIILFPPGRGGNYIIPDGVETIRNYAFSSCDKIISIVLPNSIKTIGNSAFRQCTSLATINLPSTIEEIGYSAFAHCESLNSIVIPGSISYIPVGAFSYCSSLKNVILSNGINTIRADAFYECESLKSIHIPDSVTYTGEYAFDGCHSLRTARLSPSMKLIERGCFSDCNSLQNIEIPDGFSLIGDNAFYNCSSLRKVFIPASVTEFGYIAPFAGCTALEEIIFGGSRTQWRNIWRSPSDLTSIVTFLVIEATGVNLDRSNINLKEKESIRLNATVIPNNAHNKSINWKSSNPSVASVYSDGTVKANKAGNAVITVTTEDGGYTNSCSVICSKGDDKPIYVSPYGENVHEIEKDIISNLKPADLLDDMSFGEDTLRGPYISIGWMEFYLFEIDMDVELKISDKASIQIKVNHEDKTVQLLIGYMPATGSAHINGDPNSQETKKDFDEYYKDAKEVFKIISLTPDTPLAKERFKKTYDNLQGFKSDLIVEVDTKIGGFIELSYETGKLEFSEGGAFIGVKMEKNFPARIPSFPLAYVSLKLGLSAENKVAFSKGDRMVVMDVQFNGEFSTSVGVGIGDNTGSFQGYLEGGFEGALGVEAATKGVVMAGKDPLAITMTGSLYLAGKVKASIFELGGKLKHDLVKFSIYPKLALLQEEEKRITMQSFMDNAVPIKRDYITKREIHDDATLFGFDEDYSFEKTNVFPYPEQNLVSFENGDMLLVWVDDMGNKSDYDRTSLMYSYFTNNTWSEPTPIHENGAYNDHPVVYQDGDNLHLIWMRAGIPMGENSNVYDLLSNIELCYASFDRNSKSFSDPFIVSEEPNGLAETDYCVMSNGDDISIVWMENSENDLFAFDGTNNIYFRTCHEGVWNAIEKIVETDETVNGLRLIRNDNEWHVIYSFYDMENRTDTIYEHPVGGAPQKTNMSNQLQVISGDVYYLTDKELLLNGNPTGITGITNFRVIEKDGKCAVLTLVPNGFACELYYCDFNPEKQLFEEFVQLTNFNKRIRNYSATFDEDGELVVALTLVDINHDSEDEFFGNAKLVVMTDPSFNDMVLGDVISYDNDKVLPGKELPLVFEVTNNSRNTIHSISFTFNAKDNQERQNVECNILPGETKEVTANYHLPSTFSRFNLDVYAEPDYEMDELLKNNNAASTVIGLADLLINASQPYKKDSVWGLDVDIINTGYDKTENIQLNSFSGNRSGEIISTTQIESIEPGQRWSGFFEIPEKYISSTNGMNAIQFVITSASEESNYANNETRIVYDDLGAQWKAFYEENKNAVRIVNLDDSTSGKFIIAAYDANYKMIFSRVDVHADGGLVEVPTSSQYIKVFWVTDNLMPLSSPIQFTKDNPES